MASKYRVGQLIEAGYRKLEILGSWKTCHKNTTRFTVRITDEDGTVSEGTRSTAGITAFIVGNNRVAEAALAAQQNS